MVNSFFFKNLALCTLHLPPSLTQSVVGRLVLQPPLMDRSKHLDTRRNSDQPRSRKKSGSFITNTAGIRFMPKGRI